MRNVVIIKDWAYRSKGNIESTKRAYRETTLTRPHSESAPFSVFHQALTTAAYVQAVCWTGALGGYDGL